MPGESVFIGLGSNRGHRAGHIREALSSLAAAGMPITAVSSLYLSEPVPPAGEVTENPWYLNCVARVEAGSSPRRLLALCQELEAGAGRPPVSDRSAGEPRSLDLDLLLYGDRVIAEPQLEIPHPRLHRRRFVLLPLCEIAPEARHPTERLTALRLLERLSGGDGVWLLAPLRPPNPGPLNPGRRTRIAAAPRQRVSSTTAPPRRPERQAGDAGGE